MPLKINSPFLTRFAFWPGSFGPADVRTLTGINSSWRYVFEAAIGAARGRARYGTVVGTRRDNYSPLLCVVVDGMDRVNWIPPRSLKLFLTEGKRWRYSEFSTTIRGHNTGYTIRAEASQVLPPPLTEAQRTYVTGWRNDQLTSQVILSAEEAANYILPPNTL